MKSLINIMTALMGLVGATIVTIRSISYTNFSAHQEDHPWLVFNVGNR